MIYVVLLAVIGYLVADNVLLRRNRLRVRWVRKTEVYKPIHGYLHLARAKYRVTFYGAEEKLEVVDPKFDLAKQLDKLAWHDSHELDLAEAPTAEASAS